MVTTSPVWYRFVALVAFATQAVCQQCYYPNGNAAPDTEKPCSSASGSACCPENWECLDNGLCHYPPSNLFGRYSCTDKSWNSPGCASNLCTYGMTLGGGESITECSNHNNQWCCNGDAQHVNCCQESPSPRPFFALQDGNAYATIGSNQASTNPTLSTITGLASGTAAAASASSTPTSSAGSRPASVTPYTSLQTSVSSGTAGVSTMVITALVTPTAVSTDSVSTSKSSSKVPIIVGCAVGIPLALALLGIVFWMLRKRRQQKANPYKESSPDLGHDDLDSPGFIGGAAAKPGKNQVYRHSNTNSAELDSHPMGPPRPVSIVNGYAELDSGAVFRPGESTPYGPNTVGLGGGSGPPQYSPGPNQAMFVPQPNASELGSKTSLPTINEKAEGETHAPTQYQAYRPPASSNLAAELPAVKTPPEDLEKQIHR